MGADQLVIDERHDILVKDLLLTIGQFLETMECILEGVVAELVAQLAQFLAEGMTPGVLAQHQVRLGEADRLRGHDLVGASVLQHAVLMDSGFGAKALAPTIALFGWTTNR